MFSVHSDPRSRRQVRNKLFAKSIWAIRKALRTYAKRCGAVRVALVSSVGADASSSNFYFRVKGETEAAIEFLGFGSTHIFVPAS